MWHADDLDSSASYEGPQERCYCKHWQCSRLSGPSFSADQCVCWHQGQHTNQLFGNLQKQPLEHLRFCQCMTLQLVHPCCALLACVLPVSALACMCSHACMRVRFGFFARCHSTIKHTFLQACYCFLQAYVDVFTKSMQVELATSGVIMQNMAPLFVATKMSKIRKSRLDAPSATQWARAAVKHIGFETTSSPYWFHAFQWYCMSRGPTSLLNYYVLNLHLGFRKGWYKKHKAQ